MFKRVPLICNLSQPMNN